MAMKDNRFVLIQNEFMVEALEQSGGYTGAGEGTRLGNRPWL